MSNKIILIWDNVQSFLDKTSKEMDISKKYIISEDEKLNSFSYYNEATAAIILADIKWVNTSRSAFQGLDIIQYLREKQRFNKPIIVCSAMPEDFLRNKDTATSTGRILNAPGHIYYNLQDGFDSQKILSLVKQPDLEDDLLDDIVYTFYDRKGKLSELLHNLKNDILVENSTKLLREIKTDVFELIDKCYSAIRSLLNEEYQSRLAQIHAAIKDDLDADLNDQWNIQKEDSRKNHFNYRNGLAIIAKYSPQIYGFLPSGLDEGPEKREEEKIRWEALFLDDKAEARETVKNYFAERGVICHVASNYDEVFSMLEKNKSKIAVFISDIRLMEPDGRWQEKQGYQILKEVHQTHTSSLAFVALTSKKGTITKKIQDGSDFLIHWFAKDDVLSSNASFNLFFRTIRQAGDNSFYRNKSQPSNAPWINGGTRFKLPLALYYKYHLEDVNHATEAGIIDQVALDYVNNKYRGEIAFTSSISENHVSKDGLKKFREVILTVRRIVYGLAKQGMTSEEIHRVLKPGSEATPGLLKLLFNTTLVTSLNPEKHVLALDQIADGKDIENTLLEEEIEFLNRNFKTKLSVKEVRLDNDDLEDIDSLFYTVRTKLLDENSSKEIATLKAFSDNLNKNIKPNIKEIDSLFKMLMKVSEERNLNKPIKDAISKMLKDLNNAKLFSTINKYV